MHESDLRRRAANKRPSGGLSVISVAELISTNFFLEDRSEGSSILLLPTAFGCTNSFATDVSINSRICFVNCLWSSTGKVLVDGTGKSTL